ncbi:hypothetical protein HAX54_002143, partial [Datura stramonium]|nr:hypothetical protein [Datura stramonium]
EDENDYEGDHNLEKQFNSAAHVENLELVPWLLECMSTLALEGWRFPPSSWKFLKLNTKLGELDFPGICSFLQSSSDLETLVIDWYSHDRR